MRIGGTFPDGVGVGDYSFCFISMIRGITKKDIAKGAFKYYDVPKK
jgi:hypothetical protein